MILISFQPFALKKIFAIATAIICLSTASCFASALFLSVQSTPYDRQMNRIRPILVSSPAEPDQQPSLGLVNHWMEDLREIPYGYHTEWRTPAEVRPGAPADCKGKAVALYDRMQAKGAKNLRLVIGRRAPTSTTTHTWLIWETSNGVYLLDPTFNWMACRSEQASEKSYVPFYAFAGTKKFRAASATLFANN